MSLELRQGGFPVPRIYQPSFQRQPARVMHWHLFWSTADTLHVFRPPTPGVAGVDIAAAVIEALARALVTDILARAEPSKDNGEEFDDR